MGQARNEPVFTPREWLVVVSLWVIYAALIFSMDPEWVGWAAPLAFGGALSAGDLPPRLVTSAPPQQTFEVASLLSLLGLAALGLVAFLRGEPGLRLFARLRGSLKTERVTRGFQQVMLRRKLRVRALLLARWGSSIGPETWELHPPPTAQHGVTTAPECSRIIPRDL